MREGYSLGLELLFMGYCVSPITLRNPRRIAESKMIRVPCGKCGACLKARRDSWSFRLKEELKDSISAWFVTLTYEDDKIEWSDEGFQTLNKRTLQLFLKRLRKKQSEISEVKIRYYAVGEYGSKTDRPHYHIILFNLHKVIVTEISQVWGLGQVHVGDVNDRSIHYITKYHVNRRLHPEMDDMRSPEFTLMSTKPGIGNGYIRRNSRWHVQNMYGYVRNGQYKQSMPHYYRDRIFSKGQLNGIAARAIRDIDRKYYLNIIYLQKLGNPMPEFDLEIRDLFYAQNYVAKSTDRDLF